jgi:hypothetical protein
VRVFAAEAWFAVTGDAETAVRVLVDEVEVKSRGEAEIRRISRVVPVLPILDALAAEGNTQAERIAASYPRPS